MKFCKSYFPNLVNCISQIKWRKIKSKQLKADFMMVVVSLMANQVVELGKLMHVARSSVQKNQK